MTALDSRLNAFRDDLADEDLRGRVDAARFVVGRPARIKAPVADLHTTPRADSGVNSQLVHGDDVRVFDEREGWAWVKAVHDGYVGYTPDMTLADPAGDAATHTVCAPRSFTYPAADLKLPVSAVLSMGSLVSVVDRAETRGTRYAILDTGEAMIAAHLRPVTEHEDDYVSVAERLVFTPYLWGGTSGFGLDCSGLIQLAKRMTGKTVLRDSDMQAASIGAALEASGDVPDLRRGDLVFWKGHVAILTDRENVIHASGHSMMVCREPLASALERIAPVYGLPTVYRRP